MTTYDESDLAAMMADLEFDLVERRESLKCNSRTKIREAACAFVNDLPGHRRPGVDFVGGLRITDEFLRALSDVRTDGIIVPPPSITLAKHDSR